MGREEEERERMGRGRGGLSWDARGLCVTCWVSFSEHSQSVWSLGDVC